ncbi:hypothetical protein CONLIGDRAFT_637470 [Coniochaeta ligniaria NRRL 30616]|uniref:Secreted protein n=1 Tax=Coniochaeta ligniaria NRRL 30616 TaxID=1408157 RepID=A0A1J7J0X0_9PEZI|nr:hypothetical protein CONLIGDRAFT_637470 [Coniochaeta ligniaria NRRL 30616]
MSNTLCQLLLLLPSQLCPLLFLAIFQSSSTVHHSHPEAFIPRSSSATISHRRNRLYLPEYLLVLPLSHRRAPLPVPSYHDLILRYHGAV